MTVRILHGDCRDVLRTLPESSVDSVVTDPPYELTSARPGGRSEATRGKVMGGFMGMKWDGTGVAFDVETWAQCLRVLKPGGHLVAFGGTRTYHRMVCAIEDSGFEVRDQLGWVYGSGFPKSRNLDGEWKGWGTALKPAWEPIVLARKPLQGTVAANVLRHGTGALNVDGCRVPGVVESNPSARGAGNISTSGHKGQADTGLDRVSDVGRWPANILHDGSDEVLAAFPQASGAVAPVRGTETSSKTAAVFGQFGGRATSDQRDGGGSAARFFASFKQEQQQCNPSDALTVASNSSLQSALAATAQSAAATWPSLAGIASGDWMERSTPVTASEFEALCAAGITAMASIGSGFSQESRQEKRTPNGNLASVAATREPTGTTTITASLLKSDGSVAAATLRITSTPLDRGDQDFARLRYCAKADRADRNAGLDGMAERVISVWGGIEDDLTEGKKSTKPRANHHPTVKPTDLMRWLCRLITPPGGTVLDPFAGSGSTLKAAELEGFSAIGIELNPEYIEIARRRIASDAPLFAEVA